MGIVKVVCGIVFKDDRVLICRRKPEKSLGGYWEFPGGKVEPSESYEESLRRELVEELAINVKIEEPFINHIHEYERGVIKLISFICSTDQSELVLNDHDKIKWVKISSLLNYQLAPADIPVATALIEQKQNNLNKVP